MKRIMKSFVAWIIVCVLVSVACMVLGVALMLTFNNPNVGVSVFFFGTILGLLLLGALD